ncbi:U5 small nuclear ribonucleoprotein 40 kDa protein [Lolium rigidum]|uniref:U5 small nuclear ribonucleoprotein 40 kDa protein n=1 Tax=Lolium rigidum TaxID=89674 RepID=UPI001F5C8687|nr:U5 small nuclear ribonucleoprotein 40 kDa protein [Lolium rigidum]
MAGDPPAMKRPKLEKDDSSHSHRPSSANGSGHRPPSSASTSSASDAAPPEEDMAEEAVLALIAHRERVVEQYKLKLAQYQSLLDNAESELAVARARYRDRAPPSRNPPAPPPDRRTPPPVQRDPKPSQPAQKAPAPQTRPQLVIPGTNSRPAPRAPAPRTEPAPRPKKAAAADAPSSSSMAPQDRQKKADKKPKREIVQREPQNLIQSVRKSSPTLLKFYGSHLVPSQHKRKLRCLELCPANDQLVVTSALDGMVTLWQVQSSGPTISSLSTTNCFSPKQRWPEDVAWHPDGDTIFAVYSADGGDSQVSMTNLNASGQKKVTFLPAKPHTKGIINNINFMPWSDTCFLTGGSDHAVILWQEKDDSWNHKRVHKDLHSSAVYGVAGLQQRKTIVSVGSDKRIISYDLSAERTEYKNLIDSKCMSVLLNPCDFNLYMVQTASPGRQLRLFDIRLRQTEVHAIGWKQSNSESQSALINQSWSPDGWYLSSGSADPVIHIFDIRYHGQTPCQSVQAHHKRVFKAVWHQTFPVLTSISSDLNVAIHKY